MGDFDIRPIRSSLIYDKLGRHYLQRRYADRIVKNAGALDGFLRRATHARLRGHFGSPGGREKQH